MPFFLLLRIDDPEAQRFIGDLQKTMALNTRDNEEGVMVKVTRLKWSLRYNDKEMDPDE